MLLFLFYTFVYTKKKCAKKVYLMILLYFNSASLYFDSYKFWFTIASHWWDILTIYSSLDSSISDPIEHN